MAVLHVPPQEPEGSRGNDPLTSVRLQLRYEIR